MERLKRAMAGATGVALAAAMLAIAGAGDGAAAKGKKGAKDADERSSRGYIGIYMQELTDDVREGLDLKGVTSGVLVSGVEEDGPADEAGLKDGDVIVAFNGEPVESPDELRGLVRSAEPGSASTIEFVRDGKKDKITVTLGEREDFTYSFHNMMDSPEVVRAFAVFGPRLGIQAHEIENDDMASYFGVKAGEGVLVLDIDDESVAEGAGVKPGDVVQTIDGEKVASVDDIREACRELEEGDEFTIGVLRHGKTQELKATMDDASAPWAFNSDGNWNGWKHHAPRALVVPPGAREDLRRELDDLKREVEKLRQQMQDLDG